MKKKNKQRVLEFIQSYSMEYEHEEYPKISTNFLSEKLDLQRTNLSSLLNQLVKEGKIAKHNGRPVLYQLVKEAKTTEDVFKQLIGCEGSLEESVNLAKAAVLYPGGKSSILLTAEKGCETSYFTNLMYEFAKAAEVLKANAPYIVFECKTYMGDPDGIQHALFDPETGLLKKAKHGILFLKHVGILPGYEREMLLSKERNCILVCHMRTDENEQAGKLWRNQMDFGIEIVPLRKRPMEERFQLVKKFFQNEAGRIQRKIEVDTSILHSLLMYEVSDNVRSLKNDIHTGCANCYARVHQMKQQLIEVLFSDFPNYIRKGLIYYKSEKETIDQIILPNYKYIFGENEVLKSNASEIHTNIYQTIDARKKKLKHHQMREDEVDSIVSQELQEDFKQYKEQLSKRVKNRKQLELIVSEQLIGQVEELLLLAQEKTESKFDESDLAALCLHINGCIVKSSGKQRVSNEEISNIIEMYPMQYQLAKDFIHQLQEKFMIQLNIDEIIFTMLFLIQGMKTKKKATVSTLIVMHGDSSATSIAHVVNVMANEKNTYAFDLKLEQNIKTAYEELKKKVQEIDQGKGIILIYDMGSIKIMSESIARETGIEIRSIELPVTLLGVASSNKAAEGGSLDEVSEYIQNDLKLGDYPFARVNQLFLDETKDLEQLIMENVTGIPEKPKQYDENGIEEVYEYLETQFGEMDMMQMRICMKTFLYEIEQTAKVELDDDKRIGLIVHIVCLIDKLQKRQSPSVNFIATNILENQPKLVQEVKRLLTPMEEEFKVKINDTEIATIISIIQQR